MNSTREQLYATADPCPRCKHQRIEGKCPRSTCAPSTVRRCAACLQFLNTYGRCRNPECAEHPRMSPATAAMWRQFRTELAAKTSKEQTR